MGQPQTQPSNMGADFLSAIFELLSKDDWLEPGRYRYYMKARIAFCDNNELPSMRDFRSFQCRDICRSGFSFLSRDVFVQDILVVMFRMKDGYVPVRAQVASQQIEMVNGQTIYVICCEFLERISLGVQKSIVDDVD